jgi:tetratricopeptide (TPR) repeat protein
MVYRLTPTEVNGSGYNKGMDEQISYDLLITGDRQFTFGGLELGNEMNLEPSSLGSAITAKYVLYQQLAANLTQSMLDFDAQIRMLQADSTNNGFQEVAAGLKEEANTKKQMAVAVLDKMIDLFPANALPYDYNMVNAASYYQLLGENEKALAIVNPLSSIALDDLRYYYYLYNKPDDGYIARQQYAGDQRDAERCLASLINIARKSGDTTLAESIEAGWNMLRTEYKIAGNAGQQAVPPQAP